LENGIYEKTTIANRKSTIFLAMGGLFLTVLHVFGTNRPKRQKCLKGR